MLLKLKTYFFFAFTFIFLAAKFFQSTQTGPETKSEVVHSVMTILIILAGIIINSILSKSLKA